MNEKEPPKYFCHYMDVDEFYYGGLKYTKRPDLWEDDSLYLFPKGTIFCEKIEVLHEVGVYV